MWLALTAEGSAHLCLVAQGTPRPSPSCLHPLGAEDEVMCTTGPDQPQAALNTTTNTTKHSCPFHLSPWGPELQRVVTAAWHGTYFCGILAFDVAFIRADLVGTVHS